MKLQVLSLFIAAAMGLAWADEPKPVGGADPAAAESGQKASEKQADAKKADEQKKKQLTEEEQAELEYKKYLEEQAKQLAEVAKRATHQQRAEVKVKGEKRGNSLQTLVLADNHQVFALVAPPRSYGPPVKKPQSEVHVYDLEGKKLHSWLVEMHGHAIAVAPDGTVYVAGDGRVASYSRDGKELTPPTELPHFATMFQDMEAFRKKAEEELKRQKEQQMESIREARKQFEERIKKIEAIKEEERTKSQVRQLEQAKSILKTYDELEKQERGMNVEDYIKGLMARLRTVNAIAVSDQDIFIACGETEGWGFAVWRFNRDLSEPKKILSGLSGCCGQMDVKTHGPNLVVAENSRHQFGIYDREGKLIARHGKRGDFGGCCNPMNTCTNGSSGDIFTAESEGIVRRYSPDGEMIAVVGTVKISGGCKNVAIGATSDADTVVFCDQPGSRFLILTRKEESKSDHDQP